MSHHEETHQNEGVNKTQSTDDDRQPQFHDDDMAPDDNEEVAGKIFIGGLSWSTTEQTLRYYFEKYGELSDVALMFDKRTGKPRYFFEHLLYILVAYSLTLEALDLLR